MQAASESRTAPARDRETSLGKGSPAAWSTAGDLGRGFALRKGSAPARRGCAGGARLEDSLESGRIDWLEVGEEFIFGFKLNAVGVLWIRPAICRWRRLHLVRVRGRLYSHHGVELEVWGWSRAEAGSGLEFWFGSGLGSELGSAPEEAGVGCGRMVPLTAGRIDPAAHRLGLMSAKMLSESSMEARRASCFAVMAWWEAKCSQMDLSSPNKSLCVRKRSSA